MFRRILPLVMVVLVQPGLANANPKRARFAPPSEYSSGYVNVVEYLMMSDPRAAADTLLHECALAQIDIDRPGATEPHSEIRLPSGPFVPVEDGEFLRVADAAIAAGRADQDTVCLVKTRRVPTIRELTDMMSSGIHVYKDVQYYTYISRVPFKLGRNLRSNPLVEWIGFAAPSSKILGGTTFIATRPITVHSLVPDNERLRADLDRAGAKIDHYFESIGNGETYFTYYIRIDPSRIERVTSLWWVYFVLQDQGVERTD